MTLDSTGTDLIQSLTRLTNIKGPQWVKEALQICAQIRRHYTPVTKGKNKKIPDTVITANDLTDIDISHVNLSLPKNVSLIKSIIKNNPE